MEEAQSRTDRLEGPREEEVQTVAAGHPPIEEEDRAVSDEEAVEDWHSARSSLASSADCEAEVEDPILREGPSGPSSGPSGPVRARGGARPSPAKLRTEGGGRGAGPESKAGFPAGGEATSSPLGPDGSTLERLPDWALRAGPSVGARG